MKNKYEKWYYSIIQKAKDRKIEEDYIENHHIKPRSVGGTDEKSNMVALTPKEHFVCHLLLTKMYSGENRRKMTYALHLMTEAKNNKNHKRNYKITSNIYSYMRKIHSENLKGKNNPNYGNGFISNYKWINNGVNNKRVNEINLEKWIGDGWVIGRVGKIKTDHFYNETIECPYCGLKSNSKANMKRWHFDNCKYKIL